MSQAALRRPFSLLFRTTLHCPDRCPDRDSVPEIYPPRAEPCGIWPLTSVTHRPNWRQLGIQIRRHRHRLHAARIATPQPFHRQSVGKVGIARVITHRIEGSPAPARVNLAQEGGGRIVLEVEGGPVQRTADMPRGSPWHRDRRHGWRRRPRSAPHKLPVGWGGQGPERSARSRSPRHGCRAGVALDRGGHEAGELGGVTRR